MASVVSPVAFDGSSRFKGGFVYIVGGGKNESVIVFGGVVFL